MIATVAAVAGLASNSYAQTSYQVLHSFDRPYSLGAYPSTGLIEGIDGSFYGTTGQGGAAGYGTIFRIDSAGTLTSHPQLPSPARRGGRRSGGCSS